MSSFAIKPDCDFVLSCLPSKDFFDGRDDDTCMGIAHGKYVYTKKDLKKLPDIYKKSLTSVLKDVYADRSLKGVKERVTLFVKDVEIFYKKGESSGFVKLANQNKTLLKKITKASKKISSFLTQIHPATKAWTEQKTRDFKERDFSFSKDLLIDTKGIKVSRLEAVKCAGLQWIWPMDDSLALTRKSIALRNLMEEGDELQESLVNSLEIVSNVSGMVLGGLLLAAGLKNHKASKVIDDKEGKKEAKTSIARGSLSVAGVGCFTLAKISDVAHIALATNSLEIIGGATLGVGTVISLGVSTYNLLRVTKFRKKLEGFLNNNKLTDLEKYRGALSFLKDQIVLSSDEIDKIKKDVKEKNKDLSSEELEDKTRVEISKKLMVKRKRFEKRAGFKSRVMVENQIDALLYMLEDKKNQTEAISKAKNFVKTVLNENNKKKKLFIVMLFASILGIAAIGALFYLHPTHLLPNVLSLTATGLWILIALYGINQSIKSYKFKKAVKEDSSMKSVYADMPLIDNVDDGDGDIDFDVDEIDGTGF
jgi:hypothetical protein